jgi:hypothetical protein
MICHLQKVLEICLRAPTYFLVNTSIFKYLDEIKFLNIFIIDEDSNSVMLTSTIEVCIYIYIYIYITYIYIYLATYESTKPIGSCQVHVLGVHSGRGTLFHYSTIIS